MANLFNALGNSRPVQNNQMNILEQYKQFRQNFTGDPNRIIQQKLQSGEFTQEQVNSAQNMLNQVYEMQRMFGK